MPIRPEERGRYPKDRPATSLRLRKERAGDRCETEGCGAVNGQPHPITGSRVVLTVAHLDHVPECCEDTNLRALCQRCHNRYDAANRRAGMRRRLRLRQAIGDLFEPRPEREQERTTTTEDRAAIDGLLEPAATKPVSRPRGRPARPGARRGGAGERSEERGGPGGG